MTDERSITQRLLTALVDRRLLTPEQLAHAKEVHTESNQPLGELLVARGFITPSDVRDVLEDELGVPALDLSSYSPEPAALRLVPADVARSKKVVPLFEIEGMLTVAVSNPLDVFSFDELSAQLAYELEPVLCDSGEVADAIAANYPDGEGAAGGAPGTGESAPEEAAAASSDVSALAQAAAAPPEGGVAAAAPEKAPTSAGPVAPPVSASTQPAQTSWGQFDLDILAVADTTNVVMLISDILTAARDSGASHVYIDPRPEDFDVVFRMGEERRRMSGTQAGLLPALLSVVRSMTRLDPQARRPATGRMRLLLHDKEESVGVSIIPTLYGERVVFSLPEGASGPATLDELGMSDEEVRELRDQMSGRGGLTLVVGPVHSGRSTTYGLMLAAAAAAGHNVVSIEDRVERESPTLWQVELLPASGLTLDEAIACAVRQDADVIGVDELRQAAELGVLLDAVADGSGVVVTLTAKDAAAAIARLVAAGVEEQSLSRALALVVTGRVVEANCRECREAYQQELALEVPLPSGATPMKGAGCESCRGTGIGGGVGVFEVIRPDDATRRAVASGAGEEELRKMLGKGTGPTLLDNAYARVAAGDVSLEAVDAVIPLRKV
jgi:type IV pilus assembly protein PilB